MEGAEILRRSTAATFVGENDTFKKTRVAKRINQQGRLKKLIIHQHQLLDEKRDSVQSPSGMQQGGE